MGVFTCYPGGVCSRKFALPQLLSKHRSSCKSYIQHQAALMAGKKMQLANEVIARRALLAASVSANH